MTLVAIQGRTNRQVQVKFVVGERDLRLQPLVELLNGIGRNRDQNSLWEPIAEKVALSLGGGKCKVESAVLSPDTKHLAVCAAVRTVLGLRLRHAGALYEIEGQSIIGRVVCGRRTAGWQIDQ